MKMKSFDVIGSNIQKIARLFPNCVTERLGKDGKPEFIIDFEKLQAELSNEILSEGEERYQFTWPEKRTANYLANTSTSMTLRPCREESVVFDYTQNLYIEGDNLDVLKVLRETYLGKVKMIYIDPPYNTGNDFVYNDDFAQNRDEFEETSGLFDEEGNQTLDPMQRNTESNGRFHTDWLNMIYPRLKVARDLLTEDGVIFISIDDNELGNLRKCGDEIFGKSQFLACFVWKRRSSSAMDRSKCSVDHEYILAYKMPGFKNLRGIDKNYKGYTNPDNDPRGPWTTGDLTVGMTGDMRPNQYYDLIDPKTGIVYKPNYNRVWSYIPESMDMLIKDNRIVFPNDPKKRPMKKRFASELDSETNPQSTWLEDIGLNTEATRQINEIFGLSLFNYSKPLSLIKKLVQQTTTKEDYVLDFFSGSATTAHAVMQLNAEDGGNRKFIMVQLPELTDEKSEAYKAGYKNICEIGKERIRRAGKKIKEDNKDKEGIDKLDTGFRVLKLDSSNMEDVYYTPQEFSLQSLFNENVKADRTNEDLLFQVMLDLGIELSAKIETKKISGKTVHFVDDNYLVACFDREVNETVITEIAKLHPVYFVMRDASAANDNVIDNFEQLFEAYSKDTIRKIL